MITRLVVLAATATGCLVAPEAASAATFCVQSPPGCVGTSETTVDAAVTDAASSAGRDRIVVAAGTFSDSFNDGVGNPVDIVGQGTGVGGTTLNLPNTDFAAKLLEPSSTLRGMRLSQANSGQRALDLAGTGDGLRVDGASGDVTAVTLRSSATLRNSTVSTDGTAVEQSGGASGATIEDSTISGAYGIFNEGALTVRRVRIATHAFGLEEQLAGSAVLEDVVITLTGANVVGVHLSPTSGTSTAASHLTIVGDGSSSNQTGVAVTASAVNSILNLRDSVLRSLTTHLKREAFAHRADLNVSYSDYDFSKVVDSNTGTGTGSLTSAHNLNNVDPQFVNALAGDYHLTAGSPLIDAGTPGPLAPSESKFDADSTPRRLDGTGDCVAVVDIGAFEFKAPARAPIARARTAAKGEIFDPVTFDASASCDPDVGDTLTYHWTFDDGGTAIGRVVKHAFHKKGVHTGTITVRDQTGRFRTAKATVTVTDTNPVLSALVITPDTITPASAALSVAAVRGATISYRLSESASVKFRVQRAVGGRKVTGRCVKPSPTNLTSKRCTRWKTVGGGFTRSGKPGKNSFHFSGRLKGHKLKPGRYRLVAVPKDLSGKRGKAVRRGFKVHG